MTQPTPAKSIFSGSPFTGPGTVYTLIYPENCDISTRTTTRHFSTLESAKNAANDSFTKTNEILHFDGVRFAVDGSVEASLGGISFNWNIIPLPISEGVIVHVVN